MNTILLNPTDVLFFRDGRPMGGSLSGQGAAWPLPNVISSAYHAALHRAGFEGVHAHRRGQKGAYSEQRDRKFGSLVTAGPFPVSVERGEPTWYFPRPEDADGKGEVTQLPVKAEWQSRSSLPAPLIYAVGNQRPPSKTGLARWWSEGLWSQYLGTSPRGDFADKPDTKNDADFSDREHTYGIAIDPATGSVEESKFYSASYLRLRPGWQLGTFARSLDREFTSSGGSNDLVEALFGEDAGHIVVGGQQRVCSANLQGADRQRLPLPLGKVGHFQEASGKHLVKWVLLSPAIWPEISAGPSKRGTERRHHPGGWLPNWVDAEDGAVRLVTVSREERRRRRGLNYAGVGYASEENASRIHARLVSAIVPKPLPVTGYALGAGIDGEEGGAKSVHLAVPAGAVYYFEADSSADAAALATALNWHGAETHPITIVNRRSTLMGEKGFGLGVCGTWEYHSASPSNA